MKTELELTPGNCSCAYCERGRRIETICALLPAEHAEWLRGFYGMLLDQECDVEMRDAEGTPPEVAATLAFLEAGTWISKKWVQCNWDMRHHQYTHESVDQAAARILAAEVRRLRKIEGKI